MIQTRTILAALAASTIGLAAAAAPLSVGTVMGFDFGATPSGGLDFFNDSGSAAPASHAPGSVLDTAGVVVDGVGFSMNNAFANSDPAIGAIDASVSGLGFDATHAEDFAGLVSPTMTLTFTGLADNIAYDFVGISPFNGRDLVINYSSGAQSTPSFDTTGLNPHGTLTGLETNGLGTLSINVHSDSFAQLGAASVAVINAFTLTAANNVTPPPPPGRAIANGDVFGIDFGNGSNPTDTVGNDFNESNGSSAIVVGSVHSLDGDILNTVSISFSGAQFNNNDGSDADFAASNPGTAVDPYFEESVVTDIAGVFSPGDNPYVVTIDGLDDSLTYNVIAVSAAEFAGAGTEDLEVDGQTSSIVRGNTADPTWHEISGVSSTGGQLVLTFTQDQGNLANPIVNGIVIEVVPEPGSLALLGLGGLLIARRRRG